MVNEISCCTLCPPNCRNFFNELQFLNGLIFCQTKFPALFIFCIGFLVFLLVAQPWSSLKQKIIQIFVAKSWSQILNQVLVTAF